jgi:DNA-binding NarL/FixJ family response regulator
LKITPLRAGNQIKVLIVDDSPLITERIAEMVRELPCVTDVFTSADYTGALNIITEKIPEIILLDIHLPQKSGIDLLRYTRINYPGIKIIMVTNKASDYYRDLCNELGSHYFIDKSKEFEHIPGIIESYG